MLPWPDAIIAVLTALLAVSTPGVPAVWPATDAALRYEVAGVAGPVIIAMQARPRTLRVLMPRDDAVMLVDLPARSGVRLSRAQRVAFRLPETLFPQRLTEGAATLGPDGAAGAGPTLSCRPFLLSAPGIQASLCLGADGVVHAAQGTRNGRAFRFALIGPPTLAPLDPVLFRVPDGWGTR